MTGRPSEAGSVTGCREKNRWKSLSYETESGKDR